MLEVALLSLTGRATSSIMSLSLGCNGDRDKVSKGALSAAEEGVS